MMCTTDGAVPLPFADAAHCFDREPTRVKSLCMRARNLARLEVYIGKYQQLPSRNKYLKKKQQQRETYSRVRWRVRYSIMMQIRNVFL